AVYLPDGTLDPSFGGDGRVFGKGAVDAAASAIVATPDGKLTLLGSKNGDIVLERYLPNGNLDPAFGSGGVATEDFGAAEDGYAMVAQSNDAVTVAGYSSTSGSTKFLIARFKPDGSPNMSFGTAGATVTGFGGANDASVN